MSNHRETNPIADLVQKLLDQTRAGKIEWRDASTSFSAETFRAHIGEGVVSITQASRPFEVDEDVTRHDEGYVVTILNSFGQTVAEYARFDGEGNFALLKDLFDHARLVARKGDDVIGGMLEALDH